MIIKRQQSRFEGIKIYKPFPAPLLGGVILSYAFLSINPLDFIQYFVNHLFFNHIQDTTATQASRLLNEILLPSSNFVLF